MERGRQRSCLRSWPSPSINRHSRGRYASLLSSDRLGRAASFDHLVDERQLAFDLGGKHLPLPFPRKAQLLFAAAPEAVEVFQQVVSILQATPLADRSALPDEASTRRHCGSIPEALSGVPIVARRTLVANVPTAAPQCPKWVERRHSAGRQEWGKADIIAADMLALAKSFRHKMQRDYDFGRSDRTGPAMA